MPAIIITISREDTSKPWLKVSSPGTSDSVFTTQEISDIIEPFNQYLQALPGYLNTQVLATKGSKTMYITRNFDTLEHAIAARESLAEIEGSIPGKAKELFTKKRLELGLDYTYTYSVVA